jgi:hypothetical protein
MTHLSLNPNPIDNHCHVCILHLMSMRTKKLGIENMHGIVGIQEGCLDKFQQIFSQKNLVAQIKCPEDVGREIGYLSHLVILLKQKLDQMKEFGSGLSTCALLNCLIVASQKRILAWWVAKVIQQSNVIPCILQRMAG